MESSENPQVKTYCCVNVMFAGGDYRLTWPLHPSVGKLIFVLCILCEVSANFRDWRDVPYWGFEAMIIFNSSVNLAYLSNVMSVFPGQNTTWHYNAASWAWGRGITLI